VGLAEVAAMTDLPPFREFFHQRNGHPWPKAGEQHPNWPVQDWSGEIAETTADYLDLLRLELKQQSLALYLLNIPP
jgi:hypothetical protein